MTTTQIHVRAILTDPDHWIVDCTMCGVVGVCTAECNIDDMCLDHLDQHGVDTTIYRQEHWT